MNRMPILLTPVSRIKRSFVYGNYKLNFLLNPFFCSKPWIGHLIIRFHILLCHILTNIYPLNDNLTYIVNLNGSVIFWICFLELGNGKWSYSRVDISIYTKTHHNLTQNGGLFYAEISFLEVYEYIVLFQYVRCCFFWGVNNVIFLSFLNMCNR